MNHTKVCSDKNNKIKGEIKNWKFLDKLLIIVLKYTFKQCIML